ncbi:MAG: 30S ribosomal protein S16 [candidate division WOR-3 bacterium]
MVRIRLERKGKRGRPFYRLVVADSRSPMGGYVLDILGYYDPIREGNFKVDLERLQEWLARGAQITPRARSIVNLARRNREVNHG